MTTAMLRRILLVLLSVGALIPKLAAQSNSKRPVDYVNTLVGTAPLDQQKLIGNAPPLGEQVYSGFTSPAAMLPHSSTELGPVNANLDIHYLAGVRAPYFYPKSNDLRFFDRHARQPNHHACCRGFHHPTRTERLRLR